MEIDHNPLAPKQNTKPPFWKQPITLPLLLWLLLHVALTAWLAYFFTIGLDAKGQLNHHSGSETVMILFASFAIVVFCLAVLRKLGELTLRPLRRRQQRVRRE